MSVKAPLQLQHKGVNAESQASFAEEGPQEVLWPSLWAKAGSASVLDQFAQYWLLVGE